MNLYFLRHARAHPRSPKWDPDSKRPLTDEGEKQAEKVACGLRELDIDFDVILSSPYVRALKTAQIAADILKNKKLHTIAHLASDGSPEQLIEHLNKEYLKVKNILLVGHEPYMTQLMSVLLTGNKDLQIDFKKAGVAKLSVDKSLQFGKCASLDWILTPQQVAEFAK